ncbi:SEC-C metal-binding domain-containing protein [Microbulbifer sp.]|uniref:SEC-C metal-binding domain-containing protein n=1 Tax=Microbulbifer sp. TaxID=1908541 RepID=UPI003F367C54
MSSEQPLTVVISATKALEKWLGREIPRMPSPDGKRIGTQPLVTDSRTVSWQCHVIENKPGSGLYTAIAVEAHSRYTILLPFEGRASLKEFWAALEKNWSEQLVHHMREGGFIEKAQARKVFEKFLHSPLKVHCYRNTDLSVNGHVTDAEQWVKESFEEYGIDRFEREEACGVGMHINQMFKRAKNPEGVQETFYPVPRFLADGLYRFTRGLATADFPGTPRGDYPNPYGEVEGEAEGEAATLNPAREPAVAASKVGRNDPCPCGSGRKYKKCCLH